MRVRFAILLLFIPSLTHAQDTTVHKTVLRQPAYIAHSVTGTIAAGFTDWYRQYYTLPPGFEKSNTTGYIPVYGKLEYALNEHWGIAASFSYDAFVINFSQEYTGNNGPFTRYKADDVRIFSGGLAGYYHFGKPHSTSRFDPFIAFGLNLYNARYSAFPQGDSTVLSLEHSVSPMLRIGARYYFSDAFSLYADAGFDKQSIFSLGFSCRFFKKAKE